MSGCLKCKFWWHFDGVGSSKCIYGLVAESRRMGRQTFYLHNFPHTVFGKCDVADAVVLPLTDRQSYCFNLYTDCIGNTRMKKKKRDARNTIRRHRRSMLIGSGVLVGFCLFWDKVSMFIICYDFRFVLFFSCHFSFRLWTFVSVVGVLHKTRLNVQRIRNGK